MTENKINYGAKALFYICELSEAFRKYTEEDGGYLIDNMQNGTAFKSKCIRVFAEMRELLAAEEQIRQHNNKIKGE